MTALNFMELFKAELAESQKNTATDPKPTSSISDIEQFRLILPPTIGPQSSTCVYYVPSYLNEGEQQRLQKIITDKRFNCKPWNVLTKRKMQNWGGIPHPGGMYAERFPKWLQKVADRLERDSAVPSLPNQCLLNQYQAGQGISAHWDGPLYEEWAAIVSLGSPAVMYFHDRHKEYPTGDDGSDEKTPENGEESDSAATTTTAGTQSSSHHNQTVNPPPECAAFSVLLEPGSLIVFKGVIFTEFTHCIYDNVEDVIRDHCVNKGDCVVGDVIKRQARVSLTLRSVRRVARAVDDLWTDEDKLEAKRREAWWLNSISEKVNQTTAA
eukprot:TRINITY_DN66640_c1_g1_i1.p1 TRINITY_DN66640_c1_g1~~TRINITY_DN66640_c1_g1_i1.p1  ORF type:complete len:325 (+),score=30.24 TRINITY_DN66640_c1_g1_i1:40-1014(+)